MAVTVPGGSSAVAQIDPPITDPLGAVNAWATAQSLRQLLPGSESAGRENRKPARRRARTPKPTKRQLASLRFRRDPQVTQQNHQAVIDEFGEGVDPAAVVADIERNRALAHRAMRSFEGRWSPNDLADVASFVLLSGFAAYHEKPSLSGDGCLAVRRAARYGMARRAKIRRAPKRDKQTAAEMSEIRLIYLLGDLNRARGTGDVTDIDAARDEVRGWIREVYGLDVRSVRLTKRGFAGR